MLAWLLAVVLVLVPSVHLLAQEEGGDDPAKSEEGGDGSAKSQKDGDDSGTEEGGGKQKGGDEGSADQGGDDQGQADQGGGTNIVGDIAADDGADEEAKAFAKPIAKPIAKKPKLSKKKKAAVAKARLKRGNAEKVGEPAQPTGEAEPQFPELDLPELKAAAPKKEPPPPLAPLVALNPALP